MPKPSLIWFKCLSVHTVPYRALCGQHGHLLAMERKSKSGNSFGSMTFEPATVRAFGVVVRDNWQKLPTISEAVGRTESGSPCAPVRPGSVRIVSRSVFLLIGTTLPNVHTRERNLKCGPNDPFVLGFMVFDQLLGETFNKSRSI